MCISAWNFEGRIIHVDVHKGGTGAQFSFGQIKNLDFLVDVING